MSMTYKQFVEYALSLKNHSNSINDGWNLHEHQNPMDGSTLKYLVKYNIQKLHESKLSYSISEVNIEENIRSIACEYHILYNPSYSCPDLFFNMWYTDGSLLSLENVWSLVHNFFKQNVTDKWSFITQEEHPYNNNPYFRVHPCKNSHVLENVGFSSQNNLKFNPLVSWISTISPFVGLNLQLSYGQHNKFINNKYY